MWKRLRAKTRETFSRSLCFPLVVGWKAVVRLESRCSGGVILVTHPKHAVGTWNAGMIWCPSCWSRGSPCLHARVVPWARGRAAAPPRHCSAAPPRRRAAAPDTPPRAHTLSTHSRMNTPHEARMSDMAVNLFGSGLGSSLKLQRPSRAKLKFMHFSDAMLRCVHFKLRVCTAKTAKS